MAGLGAVRITRPRSADTKRSARATGDSCRVGRGPSIHGVLDVSSRSGRRLIIEIPDEEERQQCNT
jgi:hypothetical protein